MRRVSARRAVENRARRKMLERSHGPERCAWPGGCVREADDADEKVPRGRGGSITDPFNVWPLCREHHDWKHAHPIEAAAMGAFGVRQDSTVSDTTATVSGMVSDTTKHTPRIAVRISPDGIRFADELATETGRSRSDALRALFAVGSAHRPEAVARLASPTPTEETR